MRGYIPRDLKDVNQVPANEHLTMQIARQVYRINTAENALVFFKNGTPAYITKRFDVKEKGGKWGKEDFASLAGKTKDNAGVNFKYEYSYEEIGLLIKRGSKNEHNKEKAIFRSPVKPILHKQTHNPTPLSSDSNRI